MLFVMNLRAKLDVSSSNLFRHYGGFQNFKSRSRDPIRPPLTKFCISFVSTAGDESARQI